MDTPTANQAALRDGDAEPLVELRFRRAEADQLGGAAAVAKHHEQGRLTIRERIVGLTDAGSFHEVGKLTGQGRYDGPTLLAVTPAPYVMGLASIDGRPVAIGGEDFTVRGGTSWSGDRKKGGQGGFVEDLAHQYRIPLVNLIDGAGGSVTSINHRGHSVFPGVHGFERSVQLMGEVPVVCAVLGTAAGGPAGRAILSHWSVMVKNTSQVFAAGPPVVERALGQKITKEELGGHALRGDLEYLSAKVRLVEIAQGVEGQRIHAVVARGEDGGVSGEGELGAARHPGAGIWRRNQGDGGAGPSGRPDSDGH